MGGHMHQGNQQQGTILHDCRRTADETPQGQEVMAMHLKDKTTRETAGSRGDC